MIFLAAFEYAILASTFTLAKVAVGYADPLFLIGVRMTCAAPLMFLVHYIQGNKSFYVAKKDYTKLFLVGVFHIFLPFMGEFWALQFVSSSKAAITYSLTPFIAAILSYFLLKKKLSVKQIVGLSIGLLGLLPLFFSQDEIAIGAEFLHISWPEFVLLLAVTSASYAWFLVHDLMHKGYGISLINGIAMLIGGVMSLLLWFITAGDHTPLKGDLSSFLLWTGLLIVVANVIAYNLYGWLLRHVSINFMSAIGFLCPIFASLYGLVLLNEDIGLSHCIALVLVGFGIWLFYKDEIKLHGVVDD